MAAGKLPNETAGKLGPPVTVTLGISLDGKQISAVQPGSPAEKAGLKVGDILTSAGGRDIKTQIDLLDVLRAKSAGETLDIQVLRNGEPVTITAALQARTPAAK